MDRVLVKVLSVSKGLVRMGSTNSGLINFPVCEASSRPVLRFSSWHLSLLDPFFFLASLSSRLALLLAANPIFIPSLGWRSRAPRRASSSVFAIRTVPSQQDLKYQSNPKGEGNDERRSSCRWHLGGERIHP